MVNQLEIDGDPRFTMLDTVSAYARTLLSESGEEDRCRRLHAEHLLVWTEEGERHYCTPKQKLWFDRLERDHDNIRSALRWVLDQGDGEAAARFGAVLWPFWVFRGYLSEARSLLEEILSRQNVEATPAQAKALLGASWFSSAAADHERAVEQAKASARMSEKLRDKRAHARAMESLGFVYLETGRIEAAEKAFKGSLELSRKSGDDRRRAGALGALGKIALARGDDDQALALFEESMRVARWIGDEVEIGYGLLYQGDIAGRAGALDRAVDLYEEALGIFRKLGQEVNIGSTLSQLGRVLLDDGQLAAAREVLVGALRPLRESGYVRGTARALSGCAAIAIAEGDPRRAAKLLAGIEGLLERAGDELPGEDKSDFSKLSARVGEQLPEAELTRLWAEGRRLDAGELESLATQVGLALPGGHSTREAHKH